MPNSLKARIKKLAYQNIISDKDRDRIIKALEQEPKQGHWIKENPPMVERYPFCSECGLVNPFENALNYCPNCGAKMEG